MEGEELQRRRLDEDSKKLLETEAGCLQCLVSGPSGTERINSP